MPVTAISRVRGMGVALIASTSTAVRMALSCSLCSTPKRCSSSTTISPRSLNRTSAVSSRCVPMTTSTLPSRMPSLVALASLSDWNRDNPFTTTGKFANRDLGLAVADVTADQPVHGHRALHVGLDLVDAGQLVGRLDVREGVLELALPRGVGAEGVPGRGHACGVQPDQLTGDLLDRLAGAALGLGPVRAAELVERRGLAADVPGDLVERVARDEQPIGRLAALAGRVLQDEVLAGGARDGALRPLDDARDAVLLVDDEVAGPQLQRVDDVAPPRRHPPHVLGALARGAGEVGLGQHRQADAGRQEAAPET